MLISIGIHNPLIKRVTGSVSNQNYIDPSILLNLGSGLGHRCHTIIWSSEVTLWGQLFYLPWVLGTEARSGGDCGVMARLVWPVPSPVERLTGLVACIFSTDFRICVCARAT